MRIKRALQTLLLGEVDIRELMSHQVALFDTNAMLTGQDAAQIDARLQYIGAEGFRLSQVLRLGGIEQDHRVQISIAGMEAVCVIQAVLLG